MPFIRTFIAVAVLLVSLSLACVLPTQLNDPPAQTRTPESSPAPDTAVPSAAPGIPIAPIFTVTPEIPITQAAEERSIFLPLVQRMPDPKPFPAKNVILLIGDGMGLEHVKAGGMYLNGAAGSLPFEQFPYFGTLTTYSANSSITDSAAASSAIATGQKVNNGVVSKEIPGSGKDIFTLLEYARDRGLSTGLVTSTPINDATPASFGAHADNRSDKEEIVYDYIHQTRPNVLFGGGHPAMTVGLAQETGYTVVTNQAELLQLDTEAQKYVSGQFGHTYLPYETDGLDGLPHLSEMAGAALRILDNDPDGFFLMIEGGRIDNASHNRDTARMLGEMVEFARTTQVVIDWAQNEPDTLIIVLADHETGGLRVIQNNGAGNAPTVTWSSSGHTPVDVGMWISGSGLPTLPGRMDNTQIFRLLTGKPLE